VDQWTAIPIPPIAFATHFLTANQFDWGRSGFESTGIVAGVLLTILIQFERIHVQETEARMIDGDGVTIDHVGGAGPRLSKGRARKNCKK
jgi:hypothetical protein